MRQTLGRLNLLLFLAGLSATAAACGGGYTDLVIHLVSVPDEDPFAGVDTIRITVERDRSGNPVIVHTVQLPAEDLVLATVPNQGVVRVILEGFAGDKPGVVIAEGRSAWVQPDAGGHLDVQVCFCMRETVDAGGCVCP
jgi:hypothetical protein